MASLHGSPRLRMLQHPALRHLRTLKLWSVDVRGGVDEGTFSALVAMPHLSSLQMIASDSGAEWWSGLASMPSLTSLRVCEFGLPPKTMLPHVSRCAHLRHLHLEVGASPELDGGRFGAFFSGPHMGRLHSLVLNNFHAGEFRLYLNESAVLPTDDDFAVAFDALQNLRSLHLERGSDHNRLLPHVPRARSLCDLRLMPWEVNAISSEVMPPTAMLAIVLNALSALQVELDLSLQCEDQGRILDFSPIAIALQQFGDRFKMSNVPVEEAEGDEDVVSCRRPPGVGL